MRRFTLPLIVLLLCLTVTQAALAGPARKKKGKRHHNTAQTTKAMQKKHLNRTLQEKGFVRFKDSVAKKK
jgi:hypothetical protein